MSCNINLQLFLVPNNFSYFLGLGDTLSDGTKKKWDISKGREHCLQAEYDDYAQSCKNKYGGFFKCCLSAFRVEQYQSIRYRLKHMDRNLIKDVPNGMPCGNYGFCSILLGTMQCIHFPFVINHCINHCWIVWIDKSNQVI